MEKLTKDLNEAQKKAVLNTEGPVMAIAGAGSGKTSVLTRRIAHLIFNIGIPKDNILAITFTNKAANEMKVRISDLLGVSTRGMWISTFHAMCARILRDHIEYLGYKRTFLIIDDDDVTQMVKSIQKHLGIDPKLITPRNLKNHVLKLKADEKALDDFEPPLRDYLEKVYPLYQKRLKANNLVDFEDLLVLTIKLLKENRDVREHYRKLFAYVLVDEFQDTNNLQYELIKLLTNKDENVFIVGDEDQSIYAFRGANIENIRKFKRDFDDPKIILLEENYRSTNNILKAANQVIASNKNRIEKNLYSKKGEGEPLTLFKGYSAKDEADYVADTIRNLVKEGYRHSDIAVLYRTNNTSRLFEEVFMQRRLPYKIVGNTSFFKRKEIKDMVAYLRLIVNPHDNYSFKRVVNEPKRGIGAKTIETLERFAETHDYSLFDAVDVNTVPLSKRPVEKLKHFNAIISNLKDSLNQVDFNTLIDDLLNDSGYKEALKFDDMGDVRFENILELKTMFKENQQLYETEDQELLLSYILEDIALKSQEDEEADENSVTLMTLHSAKGLEFRVVFIAAAEQGVFPLHRSMGDRKEIEEERRLMYVGITRAMDRLYFTNAKQRNLYGELVSNPDSMFINEIDDSLMRFEGLAREAKATTSRYTRDVEQTKRFRQKRENLYNQNQNDLNKGDKIRHRVFGEGVVVSVTKNQCMIAFSKEHGLKTLMKDHPAIEKVKR